MDIIEIFDYPIAIVLLFTLEPCIEWIMDSFCYLTIKFIKIICHVVSYVIKICVWLAKKNINILLNCMFTMLIIFWCAQTSIILSNSFYYKEYENSNMNIYDIIEKEHDNLIEKIYKCKNKTY